MPGSMDDILKSLLDTNDADLTKIAEELSTEFLAQKKTQQKIASSLEDQGRRIARGFVSELTKLGFGNLLGKKADEMVSPAVEQPSNVTEMPDPNITTATPTGGATEEDLGSVLSELGVSTEGLGDLSGQTSAGGELQRGPAEPSEEEAAVAAVNSLLQQTSSVSPESAVAGQTTSPQAANVASTDESKIDAVLDTLGGMLGEEPVAPEDIVEGAAGTEPLPEEALMPAASDPYADIDPYGELIARNYLRNLGWF